MTQTLHSAAFGRWIAIVMSVLLLFYMLVTAVQIRRTGMYYGNVLLGSFKGDVSYAYGRPAFVSDDGGRSWSSLAQGAEPNRYDVWGYELTSGGRLNVSFSPDDGHVAHVSCGHPDRGPYACPQTLGIALGDDEIAIAQRIGDPAVQSITGTTKIMRYPDTGLELHLLQFKVNKIVLHADEGSVGGKLFRFARMLVP